MHVEYLVTFYHPMMQRTQFLFYHPRERMVYKRVRVAFRFEEVEPGGVDFDVS